MEASHTRRYVMRSVLLERVSASMMYLNKQNGLHVSGAFSGSVTPFTGNKVVVIWYEWASNMGFTHVWIVDV